MGQSTLLLTSQDAQQRRVGQLLAGLEYENLVTALTLALEAQASIAGYYEALLEYLVAKQESHRGLALFQAILDRFERYPAEKLTGPLGVEFASILGSTANWQLDLKQYAAAETSYQKILQLVPQVAQLGHEEAKRLQARIYHELGMVAQQQDQFKQAKMYYQQALQLKIEYNDRYKQAKTYHGLGVVAQAQRQFEQAEQYLQLALQLYIEFNDRYEQARTYRQVGILEREREQWTQAREYLLRALEIFVNYQDDERIDQTLYSLALLWQSSHDAELPAAIASMLGTSPKKIKALLRKSLE